MAKEISIYLKDPPVLDPGFEPVALWNRSYREFVESSGLGQRLGIALKRAEGAVSVQKCRVLPHREPWKSLNERYVERMVKYLLWQKGGYELSLSGDPEIAEHIRNVYSPAGARAFDFEFMGNQIFGKPFTVRHVSEEDLPQEQEVSQASGGHFQGCRVGFDLGGSDRKCAAVIDGEVIHSEEVVWDPYFAKDPDWHFSEINDSIRRAAAKLPQLDAVGGSAAGVYVNNEVRAASIFRGVSKADFENRVRRIFLDLQKEWGDVPFTVVNDGEVTALAGSMALKDTAVLGIAMGTSLAAGYVTPKGCITTWLNELAFVPVDMRPDAPVDEWSGDTGVGAQYFSQQAVARLAPLAGIDFPAETPLPKRLVEVQRLADAGDERAVSVFETIGSYLGYNLAQYAEVYDLRNVLVLGRVMTGAAGDIVLSGARKVLSSEFPKLVAQIKIVTPGEKEKRLGQAMAAASLPALGRDSEEEA